MRQRGARVMASAVAVVLTLAGCGAGYRQGPTGGPSPTASAGPPATSRTALPGASGAPSPPSSGGPTCLAADILVDVASDRPEYRTGESVTFVVTASNVGGSPCALPTGACLPQVQIANADGTVVWDRAMTVVMCDSGPPAAMRPGASLTWTLGWDGTICSGRSLESCRSQPVPAGTYRATADWGGPRFGVTTFVVRG